MANHRHRPLHHIVEHRASSASIVTASGQTINEEWQHMFGGGGGGAGGGTMIGQTGGDASTAEVPSSSPRFTVGSGGESPPTSRSPVPVPVPPPHEIGTEARASPAKTTATAAASASDEDRAGRGGSPVVAKSYGQDEACYAKCKVSLDSLLRKKRGEYLLRQRKQERLGLGAGVSSGGTAQQATAGYSGRGSPPAGWKPKGQLRAHLHEHDVRVRNEAGSQKFTAEMLFFPLYLFFRERL